MPDYSKETCEGCVHREDESCGCIENWVNVPNVGGYHLRPESSADGEICEHFSPSLECRLVRALEEIAHLIGPHIVGPEGGDVA